MTPSVIFAHFWPGQHRYVAPLLPSDAIAAKSDYVEYHWLWLFPFISVIIVLINARVFIEKRGTVYIPAHFREDNLEVLHRLMRDYSFATLVSMGDGGVPSATPLPFLLEAEPIPYGTLKAHMALGNPQWRTFQPDCEVLVLFQGPHTYITPSWYEEALSVPTWNYATVHAYGIARIIKDSALLYEHLKSLVQTHEAQFANPWPFEDLPNEFVEKKMKGVVGFAIEITRLEGKFKMSQNRPQNDRTRVAAELRKSQDTTLTTVGELVGGFHEHLRDDAANVTTH